MRMQSKMEYFLMAFTLFSAKAQPVPLDVNFKMIDIENKPLAGVPVRLVFGSGPEWQSPNAGNRFVTDAKGEAHFTTKVVIERRWQSQNVGFTPLSVPIRTDHVRVAAELEQKFPVDTGEGYRSIQMLLTMDIDCNRDGDCSTHDFTAIYLPDATGRFARRPERFQSYEAWRIEEFGGLVMWGLGYKAADFLMTADPDHPDGKRTLQLAFKRQPLPVRR
jgi:hypothetical protein